MGVDQKITPIFYWIYFSILSSRIGNFTTCMLVLRTNGHASIVVVRGLSPFSQI
jgi:hypothetical protein